MRYDTESSARQSEWASLSRTNFAALGDDVPTAVTRVVEPKGPDPSQGQHSTVPSADSVAVVAFTSRVGSGTVVRIEPLTSLSLGRSALCSVRIDDATVSRFHACLSSTGSSFSLMDTGSRNGTFVNGERVDGSVVLQCGDSVRLGSRHGFRFLVGDGRDLKALAAAYESTTRDSLAGLLSRRLFDQALDGEIVRRHGASFALDVDGLQNVDDAHDRAVGDSVQRAIGGQLRDVVCAEGVAARTGVGEFGVVYGFICKPFEMSEVVSSMASALRRRTLESENRHHREMLERKVAERTAELKRAIAGLESAETRIRSSQAETIQRLSKAAEFRDNETARHIERMSKYCEIIAHRIGMGDNLVSLIKMASPLHDVGKIGTPDQILLKPGLLEPSEFEIMKQHAEIGYRILAGSNSDLLNMAAVIAWTHHEKVDGTGYPRGLTGTQIPIEGRIAAVADVFDALTSARVYKPAISNEKSLEILREGRGKHFDESVLDVFLQSMPDVITVQATFRDS